MKKKINKKWLIEITVMSFIISVVFSFASSEMMTGAGYAMAFVVLAIFIAVGILFDMIGVAVTSATAAPFHSMASHRERGAAEALKMLKNAEKVTSICNDVVGDISGIISGTTAAVISARMISDFSVNSVALPLIISGVVACTTIGGKAAGKSFAMRYSTQIVLRVGKILSVFSNVKIKAKVKRKSR